MKVGWFWTVLGIVAASSVAGYALFGLSEKPRSPANFSAAFITPVTIKQSQAEIEKRAGVPGVRVRAVDIDTVMLMRQRGQEITLRFDLFPDVAPVITLKVLSGLDVNEGMHSGYAQDDPNSRANLTTSNRMVSGFIEYRSRKYRIVADPEVGIHYVVEEK